MRTALWTALFLVLAYLQLRVIDYEMQVWREYQWQKEHPYETIRYEPRFRLFPSVWDF